MIFERTKHDFLAAILNDQKPGKKTAVTGEVGEIYTIIHLAVHSEEVLFERSLSAQRLKLQLS